MNSIQRRLARDLTIAAIVALAVGSTTLYFAARMLLMDEFDRAIRVKALAVSTLVAYDGAEVSLAFTDRFLRGFDDHKPRDFFQIWDADGREVARSESLRKDYDLPRRFGTLERPARWSMKLPSRRPGRAMGYLFYPKLQGKVAPGQVPQLTVVVASDSEQLEEALWSLMGLYAGVSVLLIVAALFVIRRLLKRGLQPLNALADQTARVDVETLHTRFPLGPLPVELRPIASRLNDLFGRLEQSFERERRFSADLAHELRTPLAELRAMSECALKWPDTRDAQTDSEVLVICQHMERLVGHILALTRGEEGRMEVVRVDLEIDRVVERVWQRFAPAALAKQISVELAIQPASAVADESLLVSILNNLFDNAVEYTPTGGRIAVALASEGGGPAIRVTNTVERLDPGDVQQLFDRFWRKEGSRTGDKHLGLGLTLSRAFAEAMGWKLTASSSGDLSLRMTLRPCSDSA